MSAYGQNPQPFAPAPTGGAAANPIIKNLLLAGIGGSALALLGSFLAWTSVDVEGTSDTVSGLDGDGMFTLITSLLALGLLAFGLVKQNLMAAAGSIVPSLVTLVFGVLNFLDPEKLARTYVEDETGGELSGEQLDGFMEGIDFSSSFGVWIVVLGSLVAVAAAGVLATKARAPQQ
ncbi:hypothetical protein [Streptomyces johnsoniae]|uniref:Uncharacterized protein n=1 Tax=Streptomyces johnsoniae TaxID=3075532 RepID=A0ABU2S0E3_9ACTN|nr:hypothetical protein [Streptomyces sp. DSM 41886]MDT0441904.1 hypothetical protein [Streptomyces sp. DSM 41886]